MERRELFSPTVLRELHHRALAATELVCFSVSRRRKGGRIGELRGVGIGTSIEFREHRRYLPGDDLRHVDWRASGRSGDMLLKLYEEEMAPRVDLILDASPSMFLSEEKGARVLELLYFVVESAQAKGASLRIFRVDGSEVSGMGVADLHRYHVPAPPPRSAVRRETTPAVAELPLRPSSVRVLLSDLLFAGVPEATLPFLRDGVILCPYARSEADPTWAGAVEFVDCETGQARYEEVSEEVLTHYRTLYQAHFALWREGCGAAGATLVRVPEEGALLLALEEEALPLGAVIPWG
jgi:hypothetical protein